MQNGVGVGNISNIGLVLRPLNTIKCYFSTKKFDNKYNLIFLSTYSIDNV